MALAYLSKTLSEAEYIKQRAEQSYGTARITTSALANVKLFCRDKFDLELDTILAEMKEEIIKTHEIDIAMVFLQKFITWLSIPHTDLYLNVSCTGKPVPYKAKDNDSIQQYVGQIRLYMKKVGGIPINSEDVRLYRMSYPAQKEKEEAEPLTLEEFKIICTNQKSFTRRMMYRTMKDCEARIGATVQLKKKNFDTTVSPIKVTFPAHIMKKSNGKSNTNHKYIIKEDEVELVKLLDQYSNDDDLVFGTNTNVELAINNEEKCWNRLVKKLGYTDVYSHNLRLKKNIHSIKAMTFTAAEDAVNETYAHAYGDHTRYTKTYLRWSEEKKIRKFRLLEPHITIYTKYEKVKDTELEKTIESRDETIRKLSNQIIVANDNTAPDVIREMMTSILKENKIIP